MKQKEDYKYIYIEYPKWIKVENKEILVYNKEEEDIYLNIKVEIKKKK